ncbi:Hypothetical predicted protein [Mytilus galloprovincialis]|uniref:Novel STAND NTPase 3 domain-containing protein n=1 Tax=Mytilus galloprovincialis TaxID=29158 RepID=A0A8B6D967_MYTGA|nr:Hypothetical predicted protein [Mytilus galloprovincialis]
MFITTEATRHVLKCIKENSCVTIAASPGVGKTATLRHVASQMSDEGYDVLLVTDPGDIVKFYNPKQKTLFVIDDLCGTYSLNQTDVKVWKPVMERIKKILSNKLAKIIVACRLQVYQDDKFKCLSVFKSCNPFRVYEAEIDNLQKKGFSSKYCALALCVMFNNSLKDEILTEEVNEETRIIIENTCEACKLDRGTSTFTLQDELNSLMHTFLKKEENIYKTIHDKIFDFLVYYFGQKIIHCLIKNAHSSLIKERFLLEKQDNFYPFMIIVPPKYHEMYIQRMINDWSKGEVDVVHCNINMKIPQFRQRYLCVLNELDVSYQRQLAHTCDVYINTTVLSWFCFIGDIPMIHWCVNHGVDVNQCGIAKITPLYITAKEGWKVILRMLLDIGADYNKCDNEGCSPVQIACSEGHTEIVRMLLT